MLDKDDKHFDFLIETARPILGPGGRRSDAVTFAYQRWPRLCVALRGIVDCFSHRQSDGLTHGHAEPWPWHRPSARSHITAERDPVPSVPCRGGSVVARHASSSGADRNSSRVLFGARRSSRSISVGSSASDRSRIGRRFEVRDSGRLLFLGEPVRPVLEYLQPIHRQDPFGARRRQQMDASRRRLTVRPWARSNSAAWNRAAIGSTRSAAGAACRAGIERLGRRRRLGSSAARSSAAKLRPRLSAGPAAWRRRRPARSATSPRSGSNGASRSASCGAWDIPP